MKCCFPPPGMAISPSNPLATPATGWSFSSRKSRSKGKERRAIEEGVYFNRHLGKYVAYWWLKDEKRKFIIGSYPTYSQALISRDEFLEGMEE